MQKLATRALAGAVILVPVVLNAAAAPAAAHALANLGAGGGTSWACGISAGLFAAGLLTGGTTAVVGGIGTLLFCMD